MKFPISWHQQGLVNSKQYLQEQKNKLVYLEAIIDKLEQKIAFRQEQIQIAIAEGKDGFDADKFLIKRKEKDNEPRD